MFGFPCVTEIPLNPQKLKWTRRETLQTLLLVWPLSWRYITFHLKSRQIFLIAFW